MQLTRFRSARQQLRLVSGVILFTYVAAHLTNHALGLISLAAAERGLRVAVAAWHSLPGTVLLYGGAGIHIALAFVALYDHRTLRMPPRELLRIALGFGIPTLLIAHAVTTRLAFEAYGAQPDYARIVWMLWHSNHECRQMALLVPGWLHGCLGLNFAFGHRRWFQRLRLILFGAALLLPVLATLGFLAMLKEVSILAQDPVWFSANVLSLGTVQTEKLAQTSHSMLILYFALIGVVFVARMVRSAIESLRGTLISITYPGQVVHVPRGWTVLEASRSHRIPHLSMCGGRARCSTCRVRVVAGGDRCPPPAQNELDTLNRIHAPESTRLACQLRPQGNVSVIPLLTTAPSPVRDTTEAVELEIAVMLVDFRWTSTRHSLLPQDLMYLLGHYSEIVGDSARKQNGIPIQFSDDGVTAVFGFEVGAKEASLQALAAATEVDQRLSALNDRVKQEIGWATDFAIYLHTGLVAVGETGDNAARTLTVVGKAINVARQLAAKHDSLESTRIVLSEAVTVAAELDTHAAKWRDIVLLNDERLKITSITGTKTPAQSVIAA